MNRKSFTFESKNKKKIRLKDILMLMSVFAICFISVISTADKTLEKEKTLGVTNTMDEALNEEKTLSDTPKTQESVKAQPESVIAIADVTEIKREFISPVNGAIIKPFSKNELVYSKTMDDWRTHLGVDISCPYGTDVVSSELGEVIKIEYNINYGNTVTMQCGEYTLIYTSLSSDIYVNEGERISKGTVIGKTSDSCISEICDEPHFHFEVLKNSEHIDPVEIISFK